MLWGRRRCLQLRDLLLSVGNHLCPSLVDGAHNHQDNDLERYRELWAQTARECRTFSSLHFRQKSSTAFVAVPWLAPAKP